MVGLVIKLAPAGAGGKCFCDAVRIHTRLACKASAEHRRAQCPLRPAVRSMHRELAILQVLDCMSRRLGPGFSRLAACVLPYRSHHSAYGTWDAPRSDPCSCYRDLQRCDYNERLHLVIDSQKGISTLWHPTWECQCIGGPNRACCSCSSTFGAMGQLAASRHTATPLRLPWALPNVHVHKADQQMWGPKVKMEAHNA